MTSRRSKSKLNKPKRVGYAKKIRKTRSRMPRSLGVLGDTRMAAYDMLLRDPCSANLCHAPYAGSESGYLIRTTDVFGINALATSAVTVGSAQTCSFAVYYTPGATTSGASNAAFIAAGSSNGTRTYEFSGVNGTGSTVPTVNNVLNFISSATSPVARYRAVAACLKYIPTSPLTARQGMIGAGLYEGQPVTSGVAFNGSSALALSQKYASNGSCQHEVRWLPNSNDENWASTAGANVSGSTIGLVGLNVDGVANTINNVLVSGFIEATTVWEWVPNANTVTASSMTTSPTAPLPFTTQQVLSTIQDMGAYLFDGVRMGVANAAYGATRGAIRGAVSAAYGIMTNGVKSGGTRANVMLLT